MDANVIRPYRGGANRTPNPLAVFKGSFRGGERKGVKDEGNGRKKGAKETGENTPT